MDLHFAVDSQNRNFPVFAETGSCVSLLLHLSIDLSPRIEQPYIVQDIFRTICSEQRFPCRNHVKFGCSPSYFLSAGGFKHTLCGLTSIDQRYSVINRLLRVFLEDLCHVWERRLPFKIVTEVAMRPNDAQEAITSFRCWTQRLADLVCQKSRRRDGRIMTG